MPICLLACWSVTLCRSEVDHEQMTRCLVRELTSLLKLSGVKTVTSVYFGGGASSNCTRIQAYTHMLTQSKVPCVYSQALPVWPGLALWRQSSAVSGNTLSSWQGQWLRWRLTHLCTDRQTEVACFSCRGSLLALLLGFMNIVRSAELSKWLE